ncbi:hypothetical protein DFH09DRAFT_1422850 [Mycena vulgaris]|nr:hypothetical protein DFH09DRAFT_1422850 [Mycena vulgaris]
MFRCARIPKRREQGQGQGRVDLDASGEREAEYGWATLNIIKWMRIRGGYIRRGGGARERDEGGDEDAETRMGMRNGDGAQDRYLYRMAPRMDAVERGAHKGGRGRARTEGGRGGRGWAWGRRRSKRRRRRKRQQRVRWTVCRIACRITRKTETETQWGQHARVQAGGPQIHGHTAGSGHFGALGRVAGEKGRWKKRTGRKDETKGQTTAGWVEARRRDATMGTEPRHGGKHRNALALTNAHGRLEDPEIQRGRRARESWEGQMRRGVRRRCGRQRDGREATG